MGQRADKMVSLKRISNNESRMQNVEVKKTSKFLRLKRAVIPDSRPPQ
jgi:hypothetical protein